jgi:HEAT repeat protein
MPLFGPPDVMGLAARGDAQGLTHALKYDRGGAGSMHHEVRAAAAAALGRIGGDGSVEALIAALKYPDSFDVHCAAAEALGKTGDSRAVVPLAEALAGPDSNSYEREAATLALGELGTAGAVEPLITALRDEIREVRRAAAVALGEVVGSEVVDSAATESLIAALEDPDAGVREVATEDLGKMGDGAVEPLMVAVIAPSSLVRAAAAKALARVLVSISPPAVEALSGRVDLLVVCLDSRDAALRKSAARLLGKIGNARAIEALVGALTSDSPGMVEAAADALEGLRWRPEMTASGAAYWASQGDSEKCVEIGAVGVPSLIAALGGLHQTTRLTAAEALVQMGAPVVGPLIEALADGVRQVRSNAARVLGDIGDVRAVGPLIAGLSDRNEGVRIAARDALVEIGASAVQPLIEVLRGSREWEVYLCGLAAQALTLIGSPAVEPLIAALDDKDVLVRWTAAEALGKVGDKRAVPSLVAALEDRDVREAASEALHLLGWKPAGAEAVVAFSATSAEPAGVGAIEVRADQPLVGVFRYRPDGADLDDDNAAVLEPGEGAARE